MLSLISFSYNRSCQCDLTLSTLKRQFKDFDESKISIIYKYSSQEMMNGYLRLMKMYPGINWVLEADFRSDFLGLLNKVETPLVSFFVDDDIFIDKFSLEDIEFKQFIDDTSIATLSLRLDSTKNYCYPCDEHYSLPPTNKYLWKGVGGDGGYLWSLACCNIFRLNDVKSHWNNSSFNNPNSLEQSLCNYSFPGKDYMLRYDRAKAFCCTNTRIQNYNQNRFANTHDHSILNSEFLSGKRLDSTIYDNFRSNAAHGPCEYLWK